MFKRLRARVLDRLADALSHRIAERIEKEIGARLRERALRQIEADSVRTKKDVTKERSATVRSVFPVQAYPSTRRYPQ